MRKIETDCWLGVLKFGTPHIHWKNGMVMSISDSAQNNIEIERMLIEVEPAVRTITITVLGKSHISKLMRIAASTLDSLIAHWYHLEGFVIWCFLYFLNN